MNAPRAKRRKIYARALWARRGRIHLALPPYGTPLCERTLRAPVQWSNETAMPKRPTCKDCQGVLELLWVFWPPSKGTP